MKTNRRGAIPYPIAMLLPALAFTCLSAPAFAQEDSDRYLAQEVPSMKPVIFAAGIISKDGDYEFGSVFSKDGTEFYYGVDTGEKTEIRFTQWEEGGWTAPKTILSHPLYGMNDPFLSVDETRLYYISDMPLEGTEVRKNHDIWYSEREPDGWSKPINAGPNINTEFNEYYISFTSAGSMYFASDKNDANHDIYVSKYEGHEFQPATRLGAEINTRSYEADVFISPDESYVIFAARRDEGLGRGDLYISFKQTDGTWTLSKNMGPTINTEGHELCPFVTHDGKYFFYTSRRDIYWVDARVIEGMRPSD